RTGRCPHAVRAWGSAGPRPAQRGEGRAAGRRGAGVPPAEARLYIGGRPMGKLIFALFVLVVGIGLYGAIRRRPGLLPDGFGQLVPRVILVLAIGVPALVFVLSIFRVIPARPVGVKVLFGPVG